MHLRLGQDMRMGIGKEADWAVAPTIFKPLTVMQQSLAAIPSRRRRQDLGRGQFATKSQLIHAHIGGDISWQMAFGNGDDLLASAFATGWRSRNVSGLVQALPRGARLSWLVPDEVIGDVSSPSFSVIRRFGARDDWQHFGGLKTSRLRVTIGAGGEAVMGATMIGKMLASANSVTSRHGNELPLATASPPFNLNLAPSVLAIQILDGGSRILQSTHDFALSHLSLTMTRSGMIPLFGLSNMLAIGIADGLLAIDGAIHLLHTPVLADTLREDSGLALQLTMYDDAGHGFVILLADSLVTKSEIETSNPTMPPMLKIQFESRKAKRGLASDPLIAIAMAELDAR